MTSQSEKLADELMDLRVQFSIEGDRPRPDSERLAQLLRRIRHIEKELAEAHRPMP